MIKKHAGLAFYAKNQLVEKTGQPVVTDYQGRFCFTIWGILMETGSILEV